MKPKPSTPALKILVLAALPQEIAAFRRRTGCWSRVRPASFPTWRCDRKDRSLVLTQTGMGSFRPADAFEWAASRESFDLLVSFGFGGALTPDLRVGDICVCHRFCRWDPEKRSIERHGLAVSSLEWRQALTAAVSLRACIDVTTPRLASKEQVGRQLMRSPALSPALIDMESFTLAHLAWKASLPFLTLRAISDELADPIDFDLFSVADDQGQLRIPRILSTVFRRPSLIRSFARLWRDSRKAASALGAAAAALFCLPPSSLGRLMEASIVREWDVSGGGLGSD